MGTRNMVLVKANKKVKVMQYGQWDGYPTGQGVTIAEFFKKNKDLKGFKKKVLALKSATAKQVKDLWTEVGADPNSDMVSMAIADKFNEKYPQFSRDTGAGILELINNEKAKSVFLDKSALGSDWIEYTYEIDLDKNIVNVFTGKNLKKPAASIEFSKFTKARMTKLEKELYGDDDE